PTQSIARIGPARRLGLFNFLLRLKQKQHVDAVVLQVSKQSATV
ncbi:MAG: hypothetical protein ACI9G1_004076, partial [Pirellulaceae bacterium]